MPLDASRRAARSARSIVSSTVIESRAAFHREDRAHQIAGGIVDALGEEGLVEMGVRLGERRQQQVAVVGKRLLSRSHDCSQRSMVRSHSCAHIEG